VVAAGKGDHDLSLVLDYLVVGNGVLAQDVGGDEAHLVPATNRIIHPLYRPTVRALWVMWQKGVELSLAPG